MERDANTSCQGSHENPEGPYFSQRKLEKCQFSPLCLSTCCWKSCNRLWVSLNPLSAVHGWSLLWTMFSAPLVSGCVLQWDLCLREINYSKNAVWRLPFSTQVCVFPYIWEAAGLCVFLLLIIIFQTLVGSHIPHRLRRCHTWVAAYCTNTHTGARTHTHARLVSHIFLSSNHFSVVESSCSHWTTPLPSTINNQLVGNVILVSAGKMAFN